jgi:predicted nucleotidyltransferase component of viral defense system
MIAESEVRRVAGRLGVDPMVVDHDYVLGCFLRFLARHQNVRQGWVFKGGTALAKCYFQGYRFSEDIDFTLLSPMDEASLVDVLTSVSSEVKETVGIDTSASPLTVEVVRDDYGSESFEGKVYYRGPWSYRGSPRAIQVHLSHDEVLAFPPRLRPIAHPYSDAPDLPTVEIAVYTLEEAFAEKLRAFSGQRQFAIARDVFDLAYLADGGVDSGAAIGALETKLRAKGLSKTGFSSDTVTSRRNEYQMNWEKNLLHLLPVDKRRDFEESWQTAVRFLERAMEE